MKEISVMELKLKQLLSEKGFSEDEIEEQVEKLGEVISKGVLAGLLKSKPPVGILDSFEEVEGYVKKNFSDEEIQKATMEVVEEIVPAYLESVRLSIEELM